MVIYELKDQVAWLTIDRQDKRNALNLKVVQDMLGHLDNIAGNGDIRAVVITGAGDKAFCAGADLGNMGSGASPTDLPYNIGLLLKKIAALPQPSVARVNGVCMAGGMGLMLACDMAYADENARMGTPEVRVGLFPMMVAALLFRNVTRKKAMEMIYTGRHYTAAEAEEMGLITRACPAGSLDEQVERTLEDVRGSGPLGIHLGHETLNKVEYMDLDPAIEYLCFQLTKLIRSQDAAEGFTAFKERRPPVWRNC